jgi:lipoyl(octanoyl) transferase
MDGVPTIVSGIDWIIGDTPVAYLQALAWMEARASAVAAGTASECVWLLEHPSLYTAGTSADPAELLAPRFPVFAAGRGGRYTYHGPGQRIGYLVLDLNKRGRDVRCFVHAVEGWMIRTLDRLGIAARREPGRIGIWTDDPVIGEAKIGAIGIRVRRWVSLHGFSVNLNPNLAHFDDIVPCGISEYGVTSVAKLGQNCDLIDFDAALLAEFGAFLSELNTS